MRSNATALSLDDAPDVVSRPGVADRGDVVGPGLSGMAYHDFLARKARDWRGHGITPGTLPPGLFPFQAAMTAWALSKGRAALWADTGLGKTAMAAAWAAQIPGRVLVLTPLCVAPQWIFDAQHLCQVSAGLHGQTAERIEVVNYERLHQVTPADYAGVVLDESSILKAVDGRTRTRLIEMFAKTPYRLCCTATPSPNDVAELTNHCEFLGVMSRAEMLATWFVHDEDGWRLKRHGRRAFYRWLASWGLFVRRPSDLGFSDEGYLLPPLTVERRVVGAAVAVEGQLFPEFALGGLKSRLGARRSTIEARVAETAALIQATPGPWIAWCGLNGEQELLAKYLDDGVSVAGADDDKIKAERIDSFLAGRARVLISKVRIAGFGLNLQHCHQVAFVGLSDSFEQYYQAIRRCWRFGQTQPVRVVVVSSPSERAVLENVQRKEQEYEALADGMAAEMAAWEREEIRVTARQMTATERKQWTGEHWTLYQGDAVEVLAELPEHSVDLSVYSPPFLSLYTYTASDRDLGNCTSREEFVEHLTFVLQRLLRVTKPGRLTCCHLAQVTSRKATHGLIGLIDIRGPVIEAYVRAGWTYHGDITIDKNPQAQAIRTHSKALLFVQLKKDASWLRPALADYMLVFRAPGENAVPIHPDITHEDWIEWASPIWRGIQESDTLQARRARGNDDERHLCPLQLPVIERCIRLWSNPGETVLSPFAGIGSEGHEAIRLGRRFVGIELKDSYATVAAENLARAEAEQLTARLL